MIRIAAHLCGESQSATLALQRPGWHVELARSLSDLVLRCTTTELDVAIVDPLADRDHDARPDSFLEAVTSIWRAATPIVLLSDGSLGALRTIVAAARRVPTDVAVAQPGRSTEGLEEGVLAAGASSMGMRVCAGITRSATSLDVRAEHILWDLFRVPDRYSLATRAGTLHGMAPSLLNVRLRSAGLQPFHVLRRCARVAKAYRLMTGFRLHAADAAVRAGCGSIDSFSRDARALTGRTPGRMCTALDDLAMIQALVQAAVREQRVLKGVASVR